MKKRKMMLVTTMMLAVLLIAGGTLAWFTATADPVTNEFTAGTLEINLVDEFEGADNVNPGDCYDKVVYVENLGTKRAFVRIEKDIAFDKEGLDIDVVSYELGEGWVEHNGYFYYTEELAAFVEGQEAPRTTSLFAEVECEDAYIPITIKPKNRYGTAICNVCGTKYTIKKGHTCPPPPTTTCDGNICFDGPSMDNDYQGAVFTITVNAEAVQVTNGAPFEVWGVNPLDL